LEFICGLTLDISKKNFHAIGLCLLHNPTQSQELSKYYKAK